MRVTRPSDELLLLHLEEYETGLLLNLLTEMETLLDARIEQDPVAKRLFPRAYEEEHDEDAYRSLVGDELYDEKLAAVRRARSMLGSGGAKTVELDAEALAAWLRLLTDLRLAIGTRLQVDEERMSSEVDPSDPDAPALSVLHWLGWMQESILERTTMSGGDADD